MLAFETQKELRNALLPSVFDYFRLRELTHVEITHA